MKGWQRVLDPPGWPIAVKLSVTLLLAALVPMSLTAYYNLQQSLATVEATEYRNLELLATSTASRLDQLLSDTKRVAVQVSGDREVVAFLSSSQKKREAFRSSVDLTLKNLKNSNPDYDQVFLMDGKGNCLLATEPKLVGNNYSFRDYFKQAIAGRSYLDILVGATTKKPGFHFSTPVRNDKGAIVGVAVVNMKAEAIWEIVDELRVGSQGFAFLVDEDGILIGQPDKSHLYRSLAPLPPSKQKLLDPKTRFGIEKIESLEVPELAKGMVKAKQPGHARYYLPAALAPSVAKQHRERIVGFAPMKQRSWVVGVNESKQEFAAPLNRLAVQVNLSVLAVGGCVTVLAILLARSIVKPLQKLTKAARQVEQGDFGKVRVDVKSADEIGVLADAFNQMAKGLSDRQRERDMFGRVVSPEVREQLLSGQLELGGETRWVAVLFSDIRGFSTISEQHNPQEVVALLNEYLTEMASAIRPWGGYINNFIGDAIVVVFGAPLDQPNKEWRAVAAALSMRQQLQTLNERRIARGEVTIETGIGISSGEAVVGKVGSLERLLYTVIGDAVNVAARLESLTKEYPDYPILINGQTAAALKEREEIVLKSLGPLKVKGRVEPVDVYGVIDAGKPLPAS